MCPECWLWDLPVNIHRRYQLLSNSSAPCAQCVFCEENPTGQVHIFAILKVIFETCMVGVLETQFLPNS